MTKIKTPLMILTGHSRGMGAALARLALRDGQRLLGLSRQAQPGLQSLAAPGRCDEWAVDLAEAAPVAERLQTWLHGLDPSDFSSVSLVNNAGVIAPLMPLATIAPAETARALRVGLEAAMLLSSAFLSGTADWTLPRRILNISSGLGRRAMAGSASYCAAKAGLDHFSRALALEEARRPNGARVVSLAPGVIATDMQVQLRGANPALFPNREDFIQLEAQGRLQSPEAAASQLMAWLARPDFGQTVVADVREPG